MSLNIDSVNEVDGKKVFVIDDAFDDDVQRKWIDFYRSVPFFNSGVALNIPDGEAVVNFHSNFSLAEYMNIFPVNDIMEIMKMINPEVTTKHFHRSYINAIKKNNESDGHFDFENINNDPNLFYIVALWMANPFLEPDTGGGISFGNLLLETIEYKWNRLIIFDGSIYHKIQEHTSNFTRLTTYTGFTNTQKNMTVYRGFNKW